MKKLICLFLILTMSLSLVTVSAVSAEANDSISTEEIEFMQLMGFIEDADILSYNKDFPISRGAFIKIANKIANLNDYANATVPYWDVNENNEYYTDIVNAYNTGIVEGGEGDSFRTYDTIRYAEAVKIMAVILGYKDYAMVNGGYPYGYANVARDSEFGLNNVAVDRELTYKQAVRIMFKSLTAPLLDQRFYGDYVNYSTNTQKTILYQNFKIAKVKGIVSANELTNLNFSESKCAKNSIRIGSYTYRDNENKYLDYLGYKVNCYYSADSDYNDIIYAAKTENDELVIKADSITNATSSSISYDTGSGIKTKDIKVNSSVSFIYNGKALDYATEYSDSLIKNLGLGYIEFIDNTADGEYDVIKITKYRNVVVDNTNADDMLIYGKYGVEKVILDNNVMWKIEDIDGKSYKFEELAAGDSLMVSESSDKKHVSILYSNDVVEGKIAEKDSDGYVVINGESYKISKEMLDAGYDLTAGKSGIFYVNAYGQITYYEFANGGNTGVGIIIAVEKASSLSEELMMSIKIPDNDDAVVYTLAKNVNVDGRTYKKSNDIVKAINPDGRAVVGTVVRYWVDDNGKISKLDTPVIGVNEDEKTSLVQRWSKDTNAAGPWKSMGRYNSKYWMKSTAALFAVEDNPVSADDVESYGFNVFVNDSQFKADVYSVGAETVSADVMVVSRETIESGSSIKAPMDTYFCVFESYARKLMEDGSEVGVITYYSGVNKSIAYVDGSDEAQIPALSQLKPGDAFVISVNGKNYVDVHQSPGCTNLYKIYDYETDTWVSEYSDEREAGGGNKYKYYHGKVFKKVEGYVRAGSAELFATYKDMNFTQVDEALDTFLVNYKSVGGAVYEVKRDGKVSAEVPTEALIHAYDTVGEDCDTIIAVREYDQDRRMCYFRH